MPAEPATVLLSRTERISPFILPQQSQLAAPLAIPDDLDHLDDTRRALVGKIERLRSLRDDAQEQFARYRARLTAFDDQLDRAQVALKALG